MKRTILVALGAILAGALAAPRAEAQDYATTRIFTADREGKNVQAIPQVPGMVSHGSPHWSPDGKLLVFDAVPEVRQFALARMYVYATGGPLKGMWRHVGTGGAARFSPDGNQIAFQVRPGNPEDLEEGIWVMRDDGTERKRICDGLKPRWTRDGRSLVFTSRGAGGAALESINLDGTGRRRVISEVFASIAGADTSPDGKEVCFIAYPERAYDGVLCRAPLAADESTMATVIYRGRIGWTPAWSPDGRRILFWQIDEAGNRHLSLVDADGKGAPQKLAEQEGTRYNSDAEWSPDGKQIVFTSDRAAAAP